MADGEWRDVVLLTLRETPAKPKNGVERPGEGYGLWVVARVKPDNTLFGVTLRSGRYYPNKLDGSKTLPKDGLGYYDLMELKKDGKTAGETKWGDVVKLLDPKHPPVLPSPAAEAPPPPAEEIPKMPWE
ncbi:MAG: hypothetical protein PHS14_00045 [Elusimicrobia bacterium]|nr:hypothetical protein [Elusimicrobiota bacterium]